MRRYIFFVLQKCFCSRRTGLIQRHHCPSVELKSCTLTAACLNLDHSEMRQFVKARKKGSGKLLLSSHGRTKNAIFPAMAAADGSLERSSERRQDKAASSSSGTRTVLDPKSVDSRITQYHKLYFTLHLGLSSKSGF